jgi:hypothetical protein
MVGVLVFVWAVAPSDRTRQQQMERVVVGDPGSRAEEVLGMVAVRCPVESLEHLRGSFPEGWSPAAVDVGLEALEQVTAERWVFTSVRGGSPTCAALTGQTEIGVDSAGTIVWTAPVVGRSLLAVPTWLTPSGVDGESTSPGPNQN